MAKPDIRKLLEAESLKEKSRNYLKCVERAIRAGADVNAPACDQNGKPAKSVLACAMDYTQTLSMVQLLVLHGARLDYQWLRDYNWKKEAPLHIDVLQYLCLNAGRWSFHEFCETFKYLVASGARPTKDLLQVFCDCPEGCCQYDRTKKAFVEQQIRTFRSAQNVRFTETQEKEVVS